MESNAAPEWQARSLGWRSREVMAACPLEGLVGWAQSTPGKGLSRCSAGSNRSEASGSPRQRRIAGDSGVPAARAGLQPDLPRRLLHE